MRPKKRYSYARSCGQWAVWDTKQTKCVKVCANEAEAKRVATHFNRLG